MITSGDGSYFAAQLLPGTFAVTVALPGFTTFQITGYELRVGTTTPLDVVLGVGSLEETITVSGQAPLVDLTSAEVGGTLDSAELLDMPLVRTAARSPRSRCCRASSSCRRVLAGQRRDHRQRADRRGQLA